MDDPTPNPYFVGETVKLDSLFLAGATVGSIASGEDTVYVRDPADLVLTVGAAILIEDAGYADGDLLTTVASSSGQAIKLADSAKTRATLVTVGSLADPATATCKVALPDGSESTLSVVRLSLGRYRALFTPTLAGDHYYRFEGTGTTPTAAEGRFIVVARTVP